MPACSFSFLAKQESDGNGCAVFTSSPTTAKTFESQVDVGQIGINVPVLGRYSSQRCHSIQHSDEKQRHPAQYHGRRTKSLSWAVSDQVDQHGKPRCSVELISEPVQICEAWEPLNGSSIPRPRQSLHYGSKTTRSLPTKLNFRLLAPFMTLLSLSSLRDTIVGTCRFTLSFAPPTSGRGTWASLLE